MELNYALEFLADRIWSNGESKEIAESCLMPSDFLDNPSEYSLVSDFFEKLDTYTHYDIHWNERGKSVKIRFYSGEEFGAAIIKEEHFKKEYIVNV